MKENPACVQAGPKQHWYCPPRNDENWNRWRIDRDRHRPWPGERASSWRARTIATTKLWPAACGCRRPSSVSGAARFVAERVAGLFDEPRVGAPRQITDDKVEDVIIRTLETTPRGATHWSTRAMAKATGFSHMTISRVWHAFGLQPHRTETFKLSPDPQLIEK